MADRALLLSADHYTITDQKTGEVNDLFQVWFINEYREASEREFGSKPIKMLIDPKVFDQLRAHELPALFDLDLKSRPGKANAAALTVVGFQFVGTPLIFDDAALGAPPAKTGKAVASSATV